MGKFLTRTLPLTGLRLLELASSVLVMSLLAYAIHAFDFHGSEKINYGLSVGVISVFYLLCVMIGTLIFPSLVMAGLLFITEFIVFCLWISGFIVLAYAVGKHGCSDKISSTYNPKYGSLAEFLESGGQYNVLTNQYTISGFGRACDATKTSVAFAGLATVLFIISIILLGINVLKPIKRSYGFNGFWKSGSDMNTKLHRTSGLTLSEPLEKQYDYNTATGLPEEQYLNEPTSTTGVNVNNDQQTFSTGDSSHNAYMQEKAATAAHNVVDNAATGVDANLNSAAQNAEVNANTAVNTSLNSSAV